MELDIDGYIYEDITFIDGTRIRKRTTPEGDTSYTVLSSPFTGAWDSFRNINGTLTHRSFTSNNTIHDWASIQNKTEKEVDNMNIKVKNTVNSNEHIVFCEEPTDLSPDRILKTLSAVKGRLMMEVAPIHIQKMECSMTLKTKNNIIMASKRLRMYGKKRPIVACFDDYGRPLPETIDLDTAEGITLKIIDEKEYGEDYIELKALEFPATTYTPYGDSELWTDTDTPF